MARPNGLICVTRAVKNARFVEKAAPQLIQASALPEGGLLGTMQPLQLAWLHRPDRYTAVGIDAHLAQQLAGIAFPEVNTRVKTPLFQGIVFFARISFTIQNQNNAVYSVSAADTMTAIDYATRAAVPISEYAAQYGPNSVTIHQQILPFQTTLPTNTYKDSDLQQYVNSIVTQYNLPSTACVAILNPAGVINSDAPLSKGVGGYHYKANVPYLMVNVQGQNLVVSDPGFSFAGALSHEIAEMVVDPLGDHSNPEVCDPCGPNCPSTFLCYFDDTGRYIATSQAFPPPFTYAFFINGIVQPQYATNCSPTPPHGACDSPPSLVATTGQLHVLCRSVDGVPWETIRTPTQGWTTFGDVNNWANAVQGLDPRPLIGVGAAAIGQEVHVVCTSGDGRLWETIRHADGTWTTFGDVFNRAEVRTGLDPRPLVAVGAAAIP